VNYKKLADMTGKIKNTETILSHGDIDSKKIVLDIADKTLVWLDAYQRMKNLVSLDKNILKIGCKRWDLSKIRHIYLIGAGKACNAMAMMIDHLLKDWLTEGIIIVKIVEETDYYYKTTAYVGGHPLPNKNGYEACLKILDLVDRSEEGDLFIAVISGGSTALMACPVDKISLQDEIEATDIMLKSGANVSEINTVRKHIARLNGGRLGERIRNHKADLVCINIFDAVGLMPTEDITIPQIINGTPVGPDLSTLQDAQNVICAYNLEDKLPNEILKYIFNTGIEAETPKSFPEYSYFNLNTVPDSCVYAKKIAEGMGIRVVWLTSWLEGESKEAGKFMASIAAQIQNLHTPVAPPCVVLSSGETTTIIADNASIKGHGGPSQELITAFAIEARKKAPGACMFSIDSEGTDGTTNVAGGITDSTTLKRAITQGIDLQKALREHSCYEALLPLGDLVYTGNTGTNLCDFNIMFVPELKLV
jgi:glycerate-2-kinase